jgi:hypothetical protein
MPWWIKIYLLLYSVLVIGGLYDDYEKNRSAIHYIFGIMSGGFIFTFTIAYFNPSLANSVGIWFLPMLITGVIWEFYVTTNEIIHNVHDPDLTEKENKRIENISMVLVNLFVIPGYFLGFLLSYKAIKIIL